MHKERPAPLRASRQFGEEALKPLDGGESFCVWINYFLIFTEKWFEIKSGGPMSFTWGGSGLEFGPRGWAETREA
jgi:hypothetical protein